MHFRHATSRTLSDGDRSLFIALTGSRWPLSSSVELARKLGFAHAPIEDLTVFNIAFGKTVPDVSFNARANLGYADIRFLAPVFAGDTITVETEVIGLKENSSGKTGTVYVRSTARNQTGVEVLGWVRWVMIHKRNTNSQPSPAVVPELPTSVAAEALVTDHFSENAHLISTETGVDDFWEDYVEGERVDHPLAITVNDSDHTMATHLYQNSARGHFDSILMNGQRLVYGGHIISLAKAMTYYGLENALGIIAINGGSHVAPTFAGDTICCATTILEKFRPNGHVGALRLRTIARKGSNDARSIEFPTAAGSASSEGTVLDIDYTVAIPYKQK